MSDFAVVTVAVGNDAMELAKITHPTIKAYADKIGADFVVIDEKKISKKFAHYEKFQIFDLFIKYKRIIYLDTDLIVRPDCPNLFDIVPAHKFGAFNEGKFMDFTQVMCDTCAKFKTEIKKWDRQSYNTGVFVASRLHRSIFKKPEHEYDCYGTASKHYHYEQPYLNLNIITTNAQVHELTHKFNHMYYIDSLTGDCRLSSYIIHYAGMAQGARSQLIPEDLNNWKSRAHEYGYQKNIHIDVGGGMGDQIDAEPVIRYISEKAYPNSNIRIQTDFPEIFNHMNNITVVDRKEKLTDIGLYYSMRTMPSTETLTWQVIAQSMCHTTDFTSMATLRRVLPDIDKQIKLDVKEECFDTLMKMTNGIELSELILIHPGKGWESKTFPTEYWNSIIRGISKKKPVAIIGKYVSDEQGTVDINCPEGVIDLRNILSYDELVALISKAKMVLSNDSVPVHIAGAFDNWIILIPTCKHPDHVLPYRNGSKNYKTASIYKKLTCDAIDSTPTQIYGETIDYVIGDILDYLPDPKDVIKLVNKVYK